MRVLIALMTAALAWSAEQDPQTIFRSCAYTPVLPDRAASAAAGDFQLWLVGPGGQEQRAPWSHEFDARETFRVRVSAPYPGFFYLIQDDPASHDSPLQIPATGNDQDNGVRPGTPRSFPSTAFYFSSPATVQLLMVISREPIYGLEKMTAAEARSHFRHREHCGTLVFREQSLAVKGR